MNIKERRGSGWQYHNHVLQGRYLRYMTAHVKKKSSTAEFRLAVVAGKLKGRMRGIRISSRSEVSTTELGLSSAPEGHIYVVNVSGMRPDGQDEMWQLACSTEALQKQWHEALLRAKDLNEVEEQNGTAEKLRGLASDMKAKIPVRSHVGKFRIYRNCFAGPRAVKFFQKELGCSPTQSVALCNRMLNMGLLHHVHHQHVFTNRMHFYRFGDLFNTPTEDDMDELEEPWRDAFDACRNDLRAARLALRLLQTVTHHLSDGMHQRDGKIQRLSREVRLGQLVFMGLAAALAAKDIFGLPTLVDTRFAVSLTGLFLVMFFVQRQLSSADHVDHKATDGTADMVVHESSLSLMDLLQSGGRVGDDDDDDDDAEGAIVEEEDEDDEEGTPKTSASGGATCDRVRDIYEQNPIAPLRTWPNNPLLVRRGTSMLPPNLSDVERRHWAQPLNIHSEREWTFETDLFEGAFVMTIQDLPDTPEFARGFGTTPLRCVVQGRFKRHMCTADVLSGYAYNGPLTMPTKPAWLVGALLEMAREMEPLLEANLDCTTPYALAPLLSTARVINVSRAGEEPLLRDGGSMHVEEDLSLQDRALAGMTTRQRKAFFHKRQNLQERTFDPELVYTFVLTDSQVHLPSFQVDFGFMRFGLNRLLGSFPVQVMAVHWDRSSSSSSFAPSTERPVHLPPLWEIDILHEKSLPRAQRAAFDQSESSSDSMESSREYHHSTSPGNSRPQSPGTLSGTPISRPTAHGAHPHRRRHSIGS